MKLRLTQKGFETYTGQMGVVFFEDGVSTADVSELDATRMSAVMGCEWVDGSASNVGQRYLDNMNTPAMTVDELKAASNPDAPKTVTTLDDQRAAAQVTGKTYTEDELAAVADALGIAGLREIAEPLGIKGNSIKGIIDAVMKVAGAPAPKA